MDSARLAVIAVLALAAISCADRNGEPAHPRADTSDPLAAAWDVINNVASHDDGGADADLSPLNASRTVFFRDLQLVESLSTANDMRASATPIALRGALAPAEFGFFDDVAILRQLPRRRLIEMLESDSGVRAIADLDRDGEPETYRTGWYRLPGQEPGQMLAVFEEGALRDIWTAEASEPLTISWHNGTPTVYACNCPQLARIVYQDDKLHMRWAE
jgi:hypothetical protein